MPKLQTLRPRVAEMPARLKPGTVKANLRTSGSSWAKLRADVLRAAGGRCCCETCAASGRLLPAHEVDHVTPLADGGTDDRGNLQAINRDCHARKTRAEAARRAGRQP